MTSHIPAILESFKKVTSCTVDSEFVVPFAPHSFDAPTNQFLFFLKPEATVANLEYILTVSLDVLTKAGVNFGAIRVVGGPYLDKNNIMVEHYGVISKISKEGCSAISDAAKEKLEATFGEDLKAVGLPIGGHQFLKNNPDISALSLLTINDNVGTTRLAGGTYLCKFKMLGQTQLVLNPFHAFQLVPFVKKGNALVVFECFLGTDKGSFEFLRTNLCGATNPAKAAEGSIRAELLKNFGKTGMLEVNLSSNGCHMSAGPLEGLVELKRFLSDLDNGKIVEYSQLAFGAQLAKDGLADQVDSLASNPTLTLDGKNESAFDMTEEKNCDESAQILKKALKK